MVVVEAVTQIAAMPILAALREILLILLRGERRIHSRYAVMAKTVTVLAWAETKDVCALMKQYTFPRTYLRAI
jgi:hypothetical protein